MSVPRPRVLFEDEYIIVCAKPAGVSSESPGMPELLAEESGCGRVFCVHRLDMGVGGVMVYAKTSRAAAELSKQVSERRLRKTYLAVCSGAPEPGSGEMRDLLLKDARAGKSFVVKRPRGGVKEAVLDYETLKTLEWDAGRVSLVRIELNTGRYHQIRVQFASRKMPLLGDGKYGSREKRCRTALWAHALGFAHPETGEALGFELPPPEEFPWTLFSE